MKLKFSFVLIVINKHVLDLRETTITIKPCHKAKLEFWEQNL